MVVVRHAFRWAVSFIVASTFAPWSWHSVVGQSNATPEAIESPLAACNEPDLVAETVAIPNAASSTFQAQGAVLGNGPRGIVFSNESGNDPCPWVDLAQELANGGFTMLLYRYSGWIPEADVVGAVQVLWERGVESVILVGASIGATSSLIAAAAIQLPVDAIAAISPNESSQLEEAASTLEMPVLLVTTRDDPIGSSRATTEMVFDLLPGERQVVVMAGDLHGYALLFNPEDDYVGWVLRSFLERP